jgi:predicted component of type VI protein secretion system
MHIFTISFKDKILKVVRVESGQISIGRDPECDIFIDNLAVDPVHAHVRFEDQSAFLSGGGEKQDIQLNGHPVQDEQSLKNGDIIHIGKHDIRYQYDPVQDSSRTEEAPTSPGRVVYNGWIQFLNGSSMGKTMKLDKPYMRIGRAGKSMALIAARNDGYYLSHLEGEPVTRVQDRSVGDESILLTNGDTIYVGKLQIAFFTQQTQ